MSEGPADAARPSFPTDPGQLSNSWLTGVLRASGAISSATVLEHNWVPVALQGAAAVVGQVRLTHDRPSPEAPASVVVKFASAHAPIRTVMHRFGFYRNEVEFYRQIGADAGIPTPRCYAADIDVETGCFVLVLEDMSDCRVGGSQPLSVGDVELAVDHLTAFHARWWNHARLRDLSWLVFPEGPAYHARMAGLQQSFGGALQAVRQRLGPQFPTTLADAGQRMLAHWPSFVAARANATPTLVHRDFHPQQLFFPSERGGRFAVFDWQTVGIGRGGEDLARIASLGLTTTQRAAHDRQLIERYHAGLVSHGVAGYTLAQCTDDFRFGLTSSFITNVVAAATIDFSAVAEREAEGGVTLVYAIFDRLAAAFDAHHVIALLPA